MLVCFRAKTLWKPPEPVSREVHLLSVILNKSEWINCVQTLRPPPPPPPYAFEQEVKLRRAGLLVNVENSFYERKQEQRTKQITFMRSKIESERQQVWVK